jgi:hypothetical protein
MLFLGCILPAFLSKILNTSFLSFVCVILNVKFTFTRETHFQNCYNKTFHYLSTRKGTFCTYAVLADFNCQRKMSVLTMQETIPRIYTKRLSRELKKNYTNATSSINTDRISFVSAQISSTPSIQPVHTPTDVIKTAPASNNFQSSQPDTAYPLSLKPADYLKHTPNNETKTTHK